VTNGKINKKRRIQDSDFKIFSSLDLPIDLPPLFNPPPPYVGFSRVGANRQVWPTARAERGCGAPNSSKVERNDFLPVIYYPLAEKDDNFLAGGHKKQCGYLEYLGKISKLYYPETVGKEMVNSVYDLNPFFSFFEGVYPCR